MNFEQFTDRSSTTLSRILKDRTLTQVNEAIAQYYDWIESDTELMAASGSGSGFSQALVTFLLKYVTVLLQEEIRYIYPPMTLNAALRIYLCYYRRDWFSDYYLGHIQYPCQDRWRKNWDRRRHFQAAPRAHGKSTVYSLELPLYLICYADNVRILMSSKVDDLADKYLGAVKRIIETNEKLRNDFGDLTENVNPVDGSVLEGGKGKGGWSKQVLFCRRTNMSLKDGTLESVGWGSAITGSRFDYIILDDPIEPDDCRTKKNRAKQKEYLHKLEELLETHGHFLVIGTRKHYDDVYRYLMDNPRWTYTVDKGIIKYPDRYDYVYEDDPETGKPIAVDVQIPAGVGYEVLMPEKWGITDLLLKKLGTLPSEFAREIQNEVTSDETSDFPRDWIEACRDIAVLGKRQPFWSVRPPWAKWVVIGVDLAGQFDPAEAEDRDSDYTVLTVLAVDDENTRHRIYCYRARGLDAEEQLDRMIELNDRYYPEFFVLETNAYQKAMQGLALKRKLPVYPHHTGGEKHGLEGGLPRLAIEIKNRYFVFYTGVGEAEADYQDLFCELHGYGVETHDDLVMSLWLADLGVNWLMAKEQRKVSRRDRRDQRRREKTLRHEIDGPAQRREAKAERTEDAVSDEVKAEARRRLDRALERAGVGGGKRVRQ